MPNTLTYHNGWEIRWSGWREPVNQDVRAGFWMAQRGEEWRYATTTGVVAPTNPLYVLDLTFEPGWHPITTRSSDRFAESMKARALDALREALNA